MEVEEAAGSAEMVMKPVEPWHQNIGRTNCKVVIEVVAT